MASPSLIGSLNTPVLVCHQNEDTHLLGCQDFIETALGRCSCWARADENVLIIYDERIAQKFIQKFERVQSRAQQQVGNPAAYLSNVVMN